MFAMQTFLEYDIDQKEGCDSSLIFWFALGCKFMNILFTLLEGPL